MDAVESLHTGRLDVACVSGMAVDPFGTLIIRFQKRYPEVSIRVLHAPFGTEGFEVLRRGEAELLLTDHPAPYPRHIAIPVPVSQRLIAAFAPDAADVPEGDTVTLADLMRYRLIIGTPEKSASQAEFVAQLASAKLSMPPIAVQSEHRELALPLMLAGVGVALLSEPEAEMAGRLCAQLRKIEIEPLRAGTCYHREDPLSPAARAFVSMLTTQ